jgi:hypothetical protein
MQVAPKHSLRTCRYPLAPLCTHENHPGTAKCPRSDPTCEAPRRRQWTAPWPPADSEFDEHRELAHCGERHRHACGSPSPPFQPAALANAQESPSLQGRRDRRNWSLNPELQDDLTILELHQLACVVLYACCSRGSEGVSKKNSFAIRQHVRVPCPLLLIYYRLTHH